MKSATSRCTLTLSLTHPISPPPCSGESLSPTLASTDMRKRRLKIAHTTLSGRVDGREVTLNDDRGDVRGGLYRRHPWFGTDRARSYPARPFRAPCRDSARRHTSGSCLALLGGPPRAALPPGHLEGCMVRARVRISTGALLQMGMDYWRNPTIGFGSGGNNHEAGASEWYFPSDDWQEAIFTHIKP